MQEPTHISISSASCIDLIFTSQPKLVMHREIDSSLNPNCPHLIDFLKFCLKVPEGSSEPSQTSNTEVSAKNVNGCRSLTNFAKSSMLDVRLGSKYASGFFIHLYMTSLTL